MNKEINNRVKQLEVLADKGRQKKIREFVFLFEPLYEKMKKECAKEIIAQYPDAVEELKSVFPEVSYRYVEYSELSDDETKILIYADLLRL